MDVTGLPNDSLTAELLLGLADPDSFHLEDTARTDGRIFSVVMISLSR